MPEGQVRIVDLADELGLSIATVSRALGGGSGVRPEVAQRVRDLAADRGYVANRLARSLRSQARSFVGFLVPDVQNLAYSIAAAACAEHVARSGHQLILAISGDDPERELGAIRGLAEARVSGIIVAPSRDVSAESRRLLDTMKVVEFNRTADLSGERVLCDERAAFAEATRHLVELGHQRVAYVGSSEELSNGRERLAGVRAELARHGLALPARLTRLLPPVEEDGARAAEELLTGADRPSALLVGGSNLSLGVAHALKRMKVSVPGDLSVVVYGDSGWGGLHAPALTTIEVPYRDMALAVADLVAGLMTGDQDSARGELRLPPRLVVRDSTAPPSTTQSRST